MAAVMWKIKQKYDMFRRRQRLFVEMEQMASRPFSQVHTIILFYVNINLINNYTFFSQVLVEIENKEYNEISSAVESINITNKKRKKDSPSPIALEPCEGNKAAVLSLLVRLPTGKQF
jgi:hypothetical protein